MEKTFHHHNLRINSIKENTTELLEREFYRFKRYNIISTIALIESEKVIEMELMKSNIRILDEMTKISENFYMVIFSYTEIESGYKACQNLIYKVFHNQLIHIAIDNYKKNDMKHLDIILRLNKILSEIKKDNCSVVSDESILELKHSGYYN